MHRSYFISSGCSEEQIEKIANGEFSIIYDNKLLLPGFRLSDYNIYGKISVHVHAGDIADLKSFDMRPPSLTRADGVVKDESDSEQFNEFVQFFSMCSTLWPDDNKNDGSKGKNAVQVTKKIH